MKKIVGVVSPGHGGANRANRGPTGYVEADGTLDISKKFKNELESTDMFTIYLTRTEDKTLGLRERARIAKKYSPDFFLSEHTNAGGEGAGGTSVYYSVDLPQDKELAQLISKEISSEFGIRDRGAILRTIRGPWDGKNYVEDYYAEIDEAQDLGIPHVFLVESMFHSNPEEEAILKTEEGRLRIAKAQARAVCKYYGVEYPRKPIKTGKVNAKAGLNVRKGPGVFYGKVTALNYNAGVKIYAEDKGWYNIGIGWVSAKYVTTGTNAPQRIYTVQSGDSLWKIAAKPTIYGSGLKWVQLAKLNNIKRPYTINVGQKLKY